MLKKLNNKKIVIITLCIMVLLLVIGTSVALWTKNFTQAGINESVTDCFNVTFSEGNSVSQTNLFPQTDSEGLENTPFQVTITNTCNTSATYSVILHKENTSTLANSHVKVASDNSVKLLSNLTSITSSINSSTYTAYDIGLGVVPGNKTKTVNVRSWMDENTSQSDGENKTFNYKITIEAIPGKTKLLAGNILSDGVHANTPDFSAGEPTIATYKQVFREDANYRAYSKVSGGVAYGDGFTFDDITGKFALTNIVTDKTYDNTSIGKYTCDNNTGVDCGGIYKIKDVELSSESTDYTQTITENKTVTFASDSNRTVGTGFTFDTSTGKYTLTNTTSNVTFGPEYVGYYVCRTRICNFMYKIKEVTDTSATLVDEYGRQYNQNSITKSDYYYSTMATATKGSGLYMAEDDDGTSYYYRGDVKTNYVSFANKTWRVVRINGDGTIRLILDGDIGTTGTYMMNVGLNYAKLAGYTYDNDHICNRDNPCTSTTGTANTGKTLIDNWYNSNLSDYDDKIVIGSYCSDTSVVERDTTAAEDTTYGSWARMSSSSPSLQCPTTEKDYGGYYRLKVGLLTYDEFKMSGVGTGTLTSIYLNKGGYTWTMSPIYSYLSVGVMRAFVWFTNAQDGFYSSSSNMNMTFRPVINISGDTTISGGDGSQSNPYVVE